MNRIIKPAAIVLLLTVSPLVQGAQASNTTPVSPVSFGRPVVTPLGRPVIPPHPCDVYCGGLAVIKPPGVAPTPFPSPKPVPAPIIIGGTNSTGGGGHVGVNPPGVPGVTITPIGQNPGFLNSLGFNWLGFPVGGIHGAPGVSVSPNQIPNIMPPKPLPLPKPVPAPIIIGATNSTGGGGHVGVNPPGVPGVTTTPIGQSPDLLNSLGLNWLGFPSGGNHGAPGVSVSPSQIPNI